MRACSTELLQRRSPTRRNHPQSLRGLSSGNYTDRLLDFGTTKEEEEEAGIANDDGADTKIGDGSDDGGEGDERGMAEGRGYLAAEATDRLEASLSTAVGGCGDQISAIVRRCCQGRQLREHAGGEPLAFGMPDVKRLEDLTDSTGWGQ